MVEMQDLSEDQQEQAQHQEACRNPHRGTLIRVPAVRDDLQDEDVSGPTQKVETHQEGHGGGGAQS